MARASRGGWPRLRARLAGIAPADGRIGAASAPGSRRSRKKIPGQPLCYMSNVVAWLAYDSGCANTASGYARRGFGLSRFGCPTYGRQRFVEEAHRQSAAIAASEHEADDQAFVGMRSPSTGPPLRGSPPSRRRGEMHIAAARGAYSGKPRPVVIVQDDRFDATASVTICPLTTNLVEAPLVRPESL